VRQRITHLIDIPGLVLDAIYVFKMLTKLTGAFEWRRNSSSPAREMGDEALYDLLSNRFAMQNQRIDALDAKATSAFYSGTTALVVVAALVQVNRHNLGVVPLTLLALGAFCYLMSGALVTLSFRVKRFEHRPHLADLTAVSDQNDLVTTRRWIARELRTSLEYNEPKINSKSKLVYGALIFLFWQALCLSIAAVAALY